MTRVLYFAYGSNMRTARLRARVGPVRAVGPARLPGHALRTDKPGRDGTAKANLRPSPGAVVHGVVFELGEGALEILDGFEGGYRRTRVEVVLAAGERAEAVTYVSERHGPDNRLAADYLAYLIAGAREHGLPDAWISLLEALPRRGPDRWAG